MDDDADADVGAADAGDARRARPGQPPIIEVMLGEYRSIGEEKRLFERLMLQTVGLAVTGAVAAIAAAAVARTVLPVVVIPPLLASGILASIALNEHALRLSAYLSCLEEDLLRASGVKTRKVAWESQALPRPAESEGYRPATVLVVVALAVLLVATLVGVAAFMDALILGSAEGPWQSQLVAKLHIVNEASNAPEYYSVRLAMALYVVGHIGVGLYAVIRWLGVPARMKGDRRRFEDYRGQALPGRSTHVDSSRVST